MKTLGQFFIEFLLVRSFIEVDVIGRFFLRRFLLRLEVLLCLVHVFAGPVSWFDKLL
jgi:hypothetical protein